MEGLIGPPPFGQKKKVDFIDIDIPSVGESVTHEAQTTPPNNDAKIS